MAEVPLPQWGMNMVEGTIVRWHKQPGDRVEKGEVLAEVETDKITSELEAPFSGVLTTILVGEGEVAQVRQNVAIIEES